MAIGVYIYVLFVAVVVSLIVTTVVWNRRNTQGAIPLIVLLAAISIWCLFQALSIIAEDFHTKVILSYCRFFGIETAPLAFYALAKEYLDKLKKFNLKRWFLILAFPLLCIASILTNNIHHLFYLSVSMQENVLILENGPLFWINTVYLYVFIIIGVFMFVKSYISSVSMYRKQAMLLATAAVFPIVANLCFIFELLPSNYADITPITFLISGILFFYALFYLKLLDVVPVARDRLVEEMDDIVIVLDNNKRILDLNKKARIFITNNTNDMDYIGKNVESVLDNWAELACALANSSSSDERILYHGADGLKYYHLHQSNINDRKNGKCGEVIVLRDVTQLEKALFEAKDARKEAENANKSKDFFLANMSHEIRTPMNAIIGIAEILDINEFPREKQKYYTGMILNSAQSLMTILNDILDFSKIEAGKMEIEKTPFDIKQLVDEMIGTFSITATSKSIILKSRIDENIEGYVSGDYTRVRQIMTNLIGNAVKFTHNGYVEVALEQIRKEQDKIYIKIAITDTGIGIPKENLDKVFESFKQGDNSTTRKYGGSGLGLSIVKNLTELMGGIIEVDSETGKGSSFACIIPFEPASKQEQNIAKETSEEKYLNSLAGYKLLVAEDNKINREIIGLHLKKLGCIYDFAENGMIACEKYMQNQYDAILMDVMMPEMDGLEATRKIREMEKTSEVHIPIIALTAGAMKDDIERCINSGMDAHISKPVRIQSVYNILASQLNKLTPQIQ